MPSTPAAEDLLAFPFVPLVGGRPATPTGSALRSSTSQLNLRGSPSAARSDSILRVASHGSPLAARRLPADVSPPSLLAFSPGERPVTPSTISSTLPTTDLSTDPVRDRSFSVTTEKSVTYSLLGSISSSASENADELGPLPEACVLLHRVVSGSPPPGQGSSQMVPSINLHGPDALGRSLSGSTDLSEEGTSAQIGDYDLINAATVRSFAGRLMRKTPS